MLALWSSKRPAEARLLIAPQPTLHQSLRTGCGSVCYGTTPRDAPIRSSCSRRISKSSPRRCAAAMARPGGGGAQGRQPMVLNDRVMSCMGIGKVYRVRRGRCMCCRQVLMHDACVPPTMGACMHLHWISLPPSATVTGPGDRPLHACCGARHAHAFAACMHGDSGRQGATAHAHALLLALACTARSLHGGPATHVDHATAWPQ